MDIQFSMLALPASAVLLGACANVSVLPVTAPNQPGIRYWRPAPYIALQETRDGAKTVCDYKLIMLPDKTEQYAITMDAGIGTVESKPTLEGGWNLTSLDGKADSKTAENITAVASLLSSAAKMGMQPFSGKEQPESKQAVSNCSGFYKIVYQDGVIVDFKRVRLSR